MPVDDQYRRQAGLLVRVLPLIAPETCFALKGGTAINLFVRDMPRLSVDVDLIYVPVADRATSLQDIDNAMKRIAARIANGINGARVHESPLQSENILNKLFVGTAGAQIKIEVTPVLRGCVYKPRFRSVSSTVEERFGFAEIQVVSFADLYAGKLVAALDRQHPRDLFDVRDLLANEGIDAALRKAFVVYFVSHNRPMAEVLAPTRRDISEEFLRGFNGMTDNPVGIEELVKAREDLVSAVVGRMPDKHRQFLISFKRGEPDWPQLELPGVELLPAVRWRLENLQRMDKEKREAFVHRLAEVLQAST